MTHQPNDQPARIGLILAGGQSRRMGRDKALLTHNGMTLLDHAVKLLQDAGCQVVMLSGYPRVGFVGKVIPDDVGDAGPVSGIVSSLKHLFKHYPLESQCLVVPVDMPKLSVQLLGALVEKSKAVDGALFDKHPLPFCLKFTQALQKHVQQFNELSLPKQRKPSIREFLSPLSMALLEPNSEQMKELVNVNTPEEWNLL